MIFGQALECFEQLLALPQHLLIAFSFSILQIPNSAQDYSASRCALSFRSILVASCSTFSFSTRRAAFSAWLAFAIFSFPLSFSEILCHCVASCCWCADCIWAVCCRSCFSTPVWPSWIFSCFFFFCVCVFQLPVHFLQTHFACIQLSGQFCLLVLLARVHICGSLQLCFAGLLLHLLQLVSQTSGFKPSVPAGIGIVLENKHVSCIICPSSAKLFTHIFEGLLCFFQSFGQFLSIFHWLLSLTFFEKWRSSFFTNMFYFKKMSGKWKSIFHKHICLKLFLKTLHRFHGNLVIQLKI